MLKKIAKTKPATFVRDRFDDVVPARGWLPASRGALHALLAQWLPGTSTAA
jgi:hypothetical protein